MATSGVTRFTLGKMIDHAIRRCQKDGQSITVENQKITRDCLTLALTDLQNEKMPLWCQEQILLPMYENEKTLDTPEGTIDILSAFYRTQPRIGDAYNSAEGVAANAGDGDLVTSCDQTSINGFISVQSFTPTTVAMVGIMPNGDQYYNLVFEASDDSITWTLVQTVTPPDGEVTSFYQDLRWTWYEVASPANALFFRVRETSGGVLKLRELYLASQPLDILMARLNRDQYTYLPNKQFQGGGRPLQYWLDRTLDQPQLNLWPVPNHSDTLNCIMAWRRRYINDLGDLNSIVELPTRWYNAIIWKLAHYAAYEIPGVDRKIAADNEAQAARAVSNAKSEERDDSPVIIRPNIRRYTR